MEINCLPRVGSGLPSLTAFPLLKSVIDEVEGNVKCPREIVLFSAMAAISIAVQGLYDVKKPTGQSVPTSLYMLSLADSGERKTSSESVFFDVIRQFQSESDSVWNDKILLWEVRMEIWEKRKREIKKSLAESISLGGDVSDLDCELLAHEKNKPLRPRRLKLLYDDVTPAALLLGMYQDSVSAGLVSNEGDLKGKAFSDIHKLNSLWSGGSITVDRKTAESFELKSSRLTISLMLQPSSFDEYIKKNGERLRGSGLWARFLVCQPVSTQGQRPMKNPTQSWEYRGKFSERIRELLNLNLMALNDSGFVKKDLALSPDAADLWLDAFNEIELGIGCGGRFEGAGDYASKMADNISRVAALIQVFEGGDVISVESLRFAIDFCSWCSDEFYRVFLPPKECEVNAEKLLSWLKSSRNSGYCEVKKNTILQSGPRCVRSKKNLEAALDVLVDRGLICIFNDRDSGVVWVNYSRVGVGF